MSGKKKKRAASPSCFSFPKLSTSCVKVGAVLLSLSVTYRLFAGGLFLFFFFFFFVELPQKSTEGVGRQKADGGGHAGTSDSGSQEVFFQTPSQQLERA